MGAVYLSKKYHSRLIGCKEFRKHSNGMIFYMNDFTKKGHFNNHLTKNVTEQNKQEEKKTYNICYQCPL